MTSRALRSTQLLSRIARSAARHRTMLAFAALAVLLFHGCFPTFRSEGVWKHPFYEGVVIDSLSGLPVAGATVVWREGNLSAVTDDRGQFTLPGDAGPPVGMACFGDSMQGRTLLVSHLHYQDQRFMHRHVLYGDSLESVGPIRIVPRNR